MCPHDESHTESTLSAESRSVDVVECRRLRTATWQEVASLMAAIAARPTCYKKTLGTAETYRGPRETAAQQQTCMSSLGNIRLGVVSLLGCCDANILDNAVPTIMRPTVISSEFARSDDANVDHL